MGNLSRLLILTIAMSVCILAVPMTHYTAVNGYCTGPGQQLQSRFIRIDNQWFSSDNVTVGDTISMNESLVSLVNRQAEVAALPPVDVIRTFNITDGARFVYCYPDVPRATLVENAKRISSGEWQVTNVTLAGLPTDTMKLGPGAKAFLSLQMKALRPGVYTMASALDYNFTLANGTKVSFPLELGPTQKIEVVPNALQLQECKSLGINQTSCNDESIALARPASQIAPQVWSWPSGGTPWLVGIGALIAGIFAFLSLRRRK